MSAAAEAVASWWADRLFGGTVASNGDGIQTALSVLAGAQGRPADPSKRERFVEALARRVDAVLERQADRPEWSVTLGVDYGPDPMLAEAAEEAGARGSFPWKTMTWTYATHVVASLGYQGAQRLVWSVVDWERPACGSGKYGTAPKYDRLPWKCSGLRYHEDDHAFDVPDPLCAALVEPPAEVCNRPADHFWHTDDDGGHLSHAFVVAAEVTR